MTHLQHRIEIQKGPFIYNSTSHAGRIHCLDCNTHVKWASLTEVNAAYNGCQQKTWPSLNTWNKMFRLVLKDIEDNELDITSPNHSSDIIWLAVTFTEKDQAKKSGAMYDFREKCWYTNRTDKKAINLTQWMADDDVKSVEAYQRYIRSITY